MDDEKYENLEKEIEEEIELPLQNVLLHRKIENNRYRANTLKIFILNFLTNDEIKKYIISEQKSLVSAIKRIEELGKNMNLEQILKKLVIFAKFSVDNRKQQEGEIINNVFGLLTDLIEYCEGIEKVKMQNLMNKCNVTKTVLNFMCSQEFGHITYSYMINLCCAMLEGGNSEVQTSIYEYFINNSNSER